MTADLNTVLEHLSNLVRFKSVSALPNLPIVQHMADHFRSMGADEVTILEADEPGKANLLVRYGPQDAPGIVLSGHTDVVPVSEGDWSMPPFEVTVRGERAYGRGTTDMKGFLACLMALAPEFSGRPAAAPTLWLAFTHDEEVGCLGAPALARELASRPVPPQLALIGEPSQLQVFNGHKGKTAWRIDFKGRGGHSSEAPSHVNAVEAAALVVKIIRDEANKLAVNGPFDADFSVTHPTMPVTMIKGGLGTNLTPERASVSYERRILSVENEAEARTSLEAQIREAVHAQFGSELHLTWTELFTYPPMTDATASEGYKAFSAVLPPLNGKVAFGTDGGVFETDGAIPSIICGPGSIAQAHISDEYIELDQITGALSMIRGVVNHVG